MEATQPVDVAGHLSIAARTDLQPLHNRFHWGAVPVGVTVGSDGAVYWAQYRTNTIERVSADGSDHHTVATVSGPLGLVFDRTRDRLYYTADRYYPRSIGTVLPDKSLAVLVYGDHVNRPLAITIAEKNAMLYWTESINGRIRYCDSEGQGLYTLFDDGISNTGESGDAVALSSAGIAIDEARGLLFWSDMRTATIVRSQLDGSDRRTILTPDRGLDFPTALAVDSSAGKLYWADPGRENIGRSDLNGLNPEVIANSDDGVLEPYGLAIDVDRRVLYWTDVAHNALYSTGLDEKRVERFVQLDAPSMVIADTDEASGVCGAATARARPEFLPRWIKLIRTCVVNVSATNAVMRSPYEFRLPAGTCARQLQQARDVSALQTALAADCNAAEIDAAIDAILELGTETVLADLPRAALLLRKIRPFIAGEGPAGGVHPEAALAALDDVVARMDRLAQSAATTVDWTLAASGQTTSYAASTRDAGGPTAVPDDGANRAGGPLSYKDNGDGTITDLNTGLMWEKKCDDCGDLHNYKTRFRWSAGDGSAGVYAWLHAINSEDDTGYAGYDDWRLPQVRELLSIVDYEHFNPAVHAIFDGPGCGLDCSSSFEPGCSCTNAGSYWTATKATDSEQLVPVVAFHLGLSWGQRIDSDAFVRAVRGPLTGGVEPHAKTLRFVVRAVRGPIQSVTDTPSIVEDAGAASKSQSHSQS